MESGERDSGTKHNKHKKLQKAGNTWSTNLFAAKSTEAGRVHNDLTCPYQLLWRKKSGLIASLRQTGTQVDGNGTTTSMKRQVRSGQASASRIVNWTSQLRGRSHLGGLSVHDGSVDIITIFCWIVSSLKMN